MANDAPVRLTDPTSIRALAHPARLVVIEELYKAGWTGPTVFEHTEIIAPTLVQYARPDFAERVVPEFLSGAGVWANGA